VQPAGNATAISPTSAARRASCGHDLVSPSRSSSGIDDTFAPSEFESQDIGRRLLTGPTSPEPVDIEPAWALRHNARITDGVYLALAAALDTWVITTDQALARAAPDRTRLVDQ
jgi:hypothetical protein